MTYMKYKLAGVSIKQMFLTAAVLSTLTLGTSIAQAGTIAGSKHDLSSAGAAQGAGSSTTTEICVFCHTPHGSDTSAEAPLWNKKLPDPAGFTLYSSLGTATLDGDEAAVGSVSLACLSCHDGATAMDSVLNAPTTQAGGDGYNAAGATFAGLAAMTGTPIPNLGKDLSNDHPIGIAYGGNAGGDDVASYVAPSSASVNGSTQSWVNSKGSTGAGREKVDMILFTRADTIPRVECASCHDPHNGPDGGVTNVFLRINNTGSNVCLSCHVK